ncbi:MAG: hypothetical protein ACLQVG_19465 [Terriglobia bacterium]
MWQEIPLRFLIGGSVVSAFAALGGMFKPKSFAGLFGAAPSVALATIGLAVALNGRLFAAQEARSMVAGAVAFLAYASSASWLMMRTKVRVAVAMTALIPLWLATAFASWFIFLR